MKARSGIGDWISAVYEQSVPFLQQIPRDYADFFLLNSSIREYDAGDVIIEAGVKVDSFCILQSGRALTCGKSFSDGNYNVLTYLDGGACFGETSILCNEKASNTIVAAEEGCTILHLPKENLVRFLDKNPNLTVYLYKIVVAQLNAKNQTVDEFKSLALLADAKVLPFIDFAQTLEKSRVTGTVIFECNGESGFIAFRSGRICCAKCGKLVGPDAFEKLLSWGDETLFKLDTHLMPATMNISQQSDTTSLILDALRNIDEKRNAEK